jgi:hypothetical protein
MRTLLFITLLALVHTCNAQAVQTNECVSVDGTAVDCGAAAALPVNGGTIIDNEKPSGSIDGVNAIFQLSTNPEQPKGAYLFRNGVLLKEGADYDISGNRISFRACCIPAPGDSLTATYRAGNSGRSAATGTLDNFVGQLLRDTALNDVTTSPERLRNQPFKETAPVSQPTAPVSSRETGQPDGFSLPRSLRLLVERSSGHKSGAEPVTLKPNDKYAISSELSPSLPRSMRLLMNRDSGNRSKQDVGESKQHVRHVQLGIRPWAVLKHDLSDKGNEQDAPVTASGDSNTAIPGSSSPLPRSLRLLRSRDSSRRPSGDTTPEVKTTDGTTESGTTPRALRLLRHRLSKSSSNQEQAQ